MKDQKSQRQKEEEMEYIGNMWGWKFSFISLGIIVLFVILWIVSENYSPGSDVPIPN